MLLARPAIALDPRRFGRARRPLAQAEEIAGTLRDDVRLFATTFIAGFVFVSLLIA